MYECVFLSYGVSPSYKPFDQHGFKFAIIIHADNFKYVTTKILETIILKQSL